MSDSKLTPGKVTAVAPDQATLDGLGGGGTTLPATRSSNAVAGTFVGLPKCTIPPSYMKIVYGVGGLADKNLPNGALVLDSTTKIAALKEPITFIAHGTLEFYKTWMTQAEFSQGIEAKTYSTEAEALAAGETLEWSNGVPPSVAPAMEMLMLVKRPEGCEAEQFILRLDGEFYAPVKFTMDKYLYRDVFAFFHRVKYYDAGDRGVSREEGRLDRWYLTLNTFSSENKKGNRVTHLCANYLFDKGKKIEVSDEVLADLVKLGLKEVEAVAEPVDAEEAIDV